MPNSFSWTMLGVTETTSTAQSQSEEEIRSQQPVELQSIQAAQSQEFNGFNQEEVERLRSLISNLEKPTGTCSLVYSGEFPSFIGLNVSDTTFAKSWVMDSGATNHMTHLPSIFLTYSPCPSSRKIATAMAPL